MAAITHKYWQEPPLAKTVGDKENLMASRFCETYIRLKKSYIVKMLTRTNSIWMAHVISFASKGLEFLPNWTPLRDEAQKAFRRKQVPVSERKLSRSYHITINVPNLQLIHDKSRCLQAGLIVGQFLVSKH